MKVVVTGMGVVSPMGNDVATFWEGLCDGRSAIRRIDRFDTEKLSSKIAGMAPNAVPADLGPKETRRQSRFTLFALSAADQAWQQAGVDMSRENPYRCGVFFGSGIGGLDEIYANCIAMHESGPRRVSPFLLPQGLVNMAPGLIAIRQGLRGPNRAIVTACATGTQCIGAAADALRLGQADVMVAGGAETPVIPYSMAAFCAIRALSTRNDEPERASRPFDADRDGFVMAEGAGALVLETEAHARQRGAEILAEVAGAGESCDAHHVVAPLPDGAGSAQAMRVALAEARVNPSEVSYCNAHGTSTPLNDASEALALHAVFGAAMPPVSSTKSMIGHLIGAAGAVEAIVCVMTLRNGIIHPSINYETPDPQCVVNLVANEAREAKVAIAMSNSLGFGGHNASLILKRYG